MFTHISSEEKLKNMAELLKIIAHPTRLRILCLLSQGEKRVNELENTLKMKQAVVSQQLKILRYNKLVQVERENRCATYSLLPEKRESLGMVMECLCNFIK
jgi:DNA-binding transcriptional ArsR family regulator